MHNRMRRSLKQGTSGVQSHREKNSLDIWEKRGSYSYGKKITFRLVNSNILCQKMMELTHLIRGGKNKPRIFICSKTYC